MAGFDHVNHGKDALRVWAAWLNSAGSATGGLSGMHSSAFTHADEVRESMATGAADPLAEFVEAVMLEIKGTSEYRALKLWYCVGLDITAAASQMGVGEKTFRIARERGEYYMSGRVFSWRYQGAA